MSIEIKCDTCGSALQRGHMVTVDMTYRDTSFTDASHEENHFCNIVCLGWWAKERGEDYGWFHRPRPTLKTPPPA